MNKVITDIYKTKIAGFMGVNVGDVPSCPEEAPTTYTLDQLAYDSDWSYLMPVVEKLESIMDGAISIDITANTTGVRYFPVGFDSVVPPVTLLESGVKPFNCSKIEHVFMTIGVLLTVHPYKENKLQNIVEVMVQVYDSASHLDIDEVRIDHHDEDSNQWAIDVFFKDDPEDMIALSCANIDDKTGNLTWKVPKYAYAEKVITAINDFMGEHEF